MTRWRALAGAAAGVAAVTALSRVVGFGRVAVLGRTLGTSCIGDTYTAANAVPNVVFEVVAGGALAGLVVPLIAAALTTADRDRVSQTAGALLTWALLLLVPVSLVAVIAAPWLMRLVAGSDPTCGAAELEAGTRMLRVFAPQIALYGVALVLGGVLQAHRRFLGPALMPLLSSVVVVSAYLAYAVQGGADLRTLPHRQELTLSVGTTAGVAVLALGLLVPLSRCGLRLRATTSFPVGLAARARRLALAGVLTLAAQQVALVVALRLAAHGPEGSVVVLQLATAVFLVPWAVLAVPIATTCYPELAAAAAEGRGEEFAARTGTALRAVLVTSVGGAAIVMAAAEPVARLLVQGVPGAARAGGLAAALVAFAPGLAGYGVLALLSRALYAAEDTAGGARAVAVGWLAVAAADVALVSAMPDLDRVTALGAGNSVGLSLAAVLLVIRVRRAAPGALSGAAASLGAAGLAAAMAVAVVHLLPGATATGVAGDLLRSASVAVLAAAVYLGVVWVLRPDLLRSLRHA